MNHSFDTEKTITTLKRFLTGKLLESGLNGFIIGLSGGIDSAVSASLAVTAVFDLNRGILEQGPDPLGALAAHMFLVALCGVAEELAFRYYPRLFLGNGGLVIGTVIWVILHQFYAPVTSGYRLPGDVLHGVFYIKLWRGRYWWLALAIHPLWNIAVAGGWQAAMILNS